ncbi:hypothetical protein [Oligoflexus tunisiensis]|uniref:hypothetical protein n=1 Tax=Oligoflexus tunisiensis TaxID=708132 RepID=UPI001C401E98|nr:hypothetical protein [Oligoflexus tunisiensis]
MYISLGQTFQSPKSRTKVKSYGTPDPFYTWDANGYYGPVSFGAQKLSLDSEYSSETEFTIGWASVQKNAVGFSLHLTYLPESEIERETEESTDPHDKLSRLNVGGRFFYSFATAGSDLLIAPFIGAHHALNGEFESGSPDVSVESFAISQGLEYGFKFTLHRHFEINLVQRETNWSTKMSQAMQGQFATRNADGSYTRISEITVYAEVKEALKEQLLQFVFIL